MSLSFSDAAKAKKLRDYFARHGRIYIVINATLDEVDVPEQFRGDPALRLVLNARMPQPIFIHDDVIESDFTFSGQIHACRIPMHSIWATYLPEGALDQGIIWDDSVPEMIQSIVQAVRSNIHTQDSANAGTVSDPGSEQSANKQPLLRSVEPSGHAPADNPARASKTSAETHSDQDASEPAFDADTSDSATSDSTADKGRKVRHLRVIK